MQRTAAEQFEAATAVFEGRVTQVVEREDHLEVTLMVVRTWKAADTEELVVRTGRDSAGCGVAFERDHSYLVYASPSEGEELDANLCSGTKRVEEAEAELDELGAGVTPVDPEPANELRENDDEENTASVPPSSGGCASCAVTETKRPSLAIGLALLGLALMRVRRRRQLL